MRRLTAILAVFLVTGCASQTQPKTFAVKVFERRGPSRPTSVNGQHAFLVRLTNQSEETVIIDSVSLDPESTSLQFYENVQAVDETLEPGQTRDVTMWISVTLREMNYIYTIDSVDASITAHSARGSFTETQGCTVIGSQ